LFTKWPENRQKARWARYAYTPGVQNPLGQGVYAVAETARIVGVSRERVHAWFHGWPKGQRPLFVGDYRDGRPLARVVSFLDLVDVLAVSRLLEHMSMEKVRRVYRILGEHLGGPHPFGREEFYADANGSLWLHRVDAIGSQVLTEIHSRQGGFPTLLLPYLKRIKFDPQTNLAQEITLTDSVLIDPRRRFGKPVVKGVYLQTDVLHQMYIACKSEEIAADWYGVSVEDVRAATHYEMEFRGLLAA
jgi:uncharacterized protein (DUF433 family)